ncbi:MAG TPA: hypothetical protein VMZ52_11625 [Bryobacteraceae bacterium]|nr:hypothetical protein [Bryobacteraceae bacterium]
MRQTVRCMPRRLCTTISVLAAFFFLLPAAGAATAMLDCTADSPLTGPPDAGPQLPLNPGMLLNVQWQSVTGWRVSKATLLLHLAKGSVPAQLEVALVPNPWLDSKPPSIPEKRWKFLSQKTEPHPDGWVSLEIPPPLVELAAAGKGHGFAVRDRAPAKNRWLHTRKSGQYAAHLLVEGLPAPER